MIDTDKYKIADDVVWLWNDDLDQKQGWVLWEYKECPAEKGGYPVGSDPDKTYEPYHQVLPSLIFECKIDERMDAITDLPLLLAEVKRLRVGIRGILSDYDITELIRDVPEDEWNFEQQALVRMKELIE